MKFDINQFVLMLFACLIMSGLIFFTSAEWAWLMEHENSRLDAIAFAVWLAVFSVGVPAAWVYMKSILNKGWMRILAVITVLATIAGAIMLAMESNLDDLVLHLWVGALFGAFFATAPFALIFGLSRWVRSGFTGTGE